MENKSEFQLVATGSEFVNKGIRATTPVVNKMIESASERIHMLVYSLGAVELLGPIEKKVHAGIKLTMVIDRFFETTDNRIDPKAREILLELNNLNYVNIFNFKEREKGFLHAKVIVVDSKEMFVGSANFSKGGMQNHYELGFHVKGVECQKIAAVIEDLTQNKKLTEPV